MNEIFIVLNNKKIANNTYKMILKGNTFGISKPGQFINIKLSDSYEYFLRRPISISDYDETTITIIYKTLGKGTELLSKMEIGAKLDILIPLGNGYDVNLNKEKQTIIGGGIGIPPLYRLAKELYEQGIEFNVVLGFNTKKDMFLVREFQMLGARVYVATMDGTYGYKGHVLDLIKSYNIPIEYYYACGPERMLHALVKEGYEGQLSFEERMGCGFGACMGCSCKTVTSYKRICKDGPVLQSNEVILHG